MLDSPDFLSSKDSNLLLPEDVAWEEGGMLLSTEGGTVDFLFSEDRVILDGEGVSGLFSEGRVLILDGEGVSGLFSFSEDRVLILDGEGVSGLFSFSEDRVLILSKEGVAEFFSADFFSACFFPSCFFSADFFSAGFFSGGFFSAGFFSGDVLLDRCGGRGEASLPLIPYPAK